MGKQRNHALEAAIIATFKSGNVVNISQLMGLVQTDAQFRSYSTPAFKTIVLALEKDGILKRETTDGITRFAWINVEKKKRKATKAEVRERLKNAAMLKHKKAEWHGGDNAEADPVKYACPDGERCTDEECVAENEKRAAKVESGSDVIKTVWCQKVYRIEWCRNGYCYITRMCVGGSDLVASFVDSMWTDHGSKPLPDDVRVFAWESRPGAEMSTTKDVEPLLDRSIMVIRLTTTNDGNGNPRRLSLIINADEGPMGRWQAGAIVAALDEGYIGPQVVKSWVKLCMQSWYNLTIIEGPTFSVPVSEYNATLKEHGKK